MKKLRDAFVLYPNGIKHGLSPDTCVQWRTLYRVSYGWHERSPDDHLELVLEAFENRSDAVKEELHRQLGWRPWVREDLWRAWEVAREEYVAEIAAALESEDA